MNPPKLFAILQNRLSVCPLPPPTYPAVQPRISITEVPPCTMWLTQCIAEAFCCDDTDDFMKLFCIYTLCGCGRRIPPARLAGITIREGTHNQPPGPQGNVAPNTGPAQDYRRSQPEPRMPMSYGAGSPPHASISHHGSRPYTLGGRSESRHPAGRNNGRQSEQGSRRDSRR